jgi:hypothetical protein
MVNVEEAALAPGVTALGDKLQEVCAGSPLQVSLTALPKDPPTCETVSL